MARAYSPWEVDKQWLLHPSVHDKVPPGHLADFLCDFAREALDLDAIAASYEGNLAYPPHYAPMMVALHLYAWADGLVASRRIARACEQRVDFMALTAMEHLEHDDIKSFRERHWAVLVDAYVTLTRMCRRLGLELGLPAEVPEDGLAAAAQAVLEAARAADRADDERFGADERGGEPPKWLIDKPKRARRLRDAKAALADEDRQAAARSAMRDRGEDDDKTGFIRAYVDEEEDEPAPRRAPVEDDDHPLSRRGRSNRRAALAAARPEPGHHDDRRRDDHGYDDDRSARRDDRRSETARAPEPPPRSARHERPSAGHHQRPEPVHHARPEPASTRRERPPTDHGARRPTPREERGGGETSRDARDDRPARQRTATGSYRASDAPQEVQLTSRPEAERLRVVETVVATALSDGHLAAVEERRIEQLVRILRLDPRSRQHIYALVRDKVAPPLPTAEELPDYELRLHVFEQAAIMALVDGVIAPGEHQHLRELADLLDLYIEDAKAALVRANMATDSRR